MDPEVDRIEKPRHWFRVHADGFTPKGSECSRWIGDPEVDRTEEARPWFRACTAALSPEQSLMEKTDQRPGGRPDQSAPRPWIHTHASKFSSDGSGRRPTARDREVDRTEVPRPWTVTFLPERSERR